MRESALLRHIYQAGIGESEPVSIPPGDDMGAVQLGEQQVLVTVDQLADGVHVDRATLSLAKVARKAVTRSLSDVAAMAARPAGAIVAAALPRDFGEQCAAALFDAMHQAGEAFDCPLFGGDISTWDQPLLLSVTVLAEPAGIEPVLRKGALPGDALYVSGRLGGSLETVDGYCHHLDFSPRIDPARALAQEPATRPHAMIDLSDGLGRDLWHVCEAGGLSAEVESTALPISTAAHQAAARSGLPAWRHAIGDGEDYELLFAAPAGVVPSAVAGVELHRIGRFVGAADQPTASLVFENGERLTLGEQGWEHHG